MRRRVDLDPPTPTNQISKQRQVRKKEESDSQTNGSPILQDYTPTPPTITSSNPTTPSPTPIPIVLFILCGIFYVFGNVFVNEILNENVKCELGDLFTGFDYGAFIITDTCSTISGSI